METSSRGGAEIQAEKCRVNAFHARDKEKYKLNKLQHTPQAKIMDTPKKISFFRV